MKKLILITLVITFLSQQIDLTVSAATTQLAPVLTPTPKISPTPTVAPSVTPQPSLSPDEAAQVNQNLKEMIDKVVEENKEKVQQLVQEIQKKRKAILGQVVRVSQETITIKSAKGTQILSLGSDTKLIKANKIITPDRVAVDDWALVLGSIVDDTFKPEQVFVSSTSLRPNDHVVRVGTIQKNTATILAIQPRGSQDTLEFKQLKSTKWQDSTGATTSKTNFTSDIQCLVVGYQEKDSFFVVTVRALAPFAKE